MSQPANSNQFNDKSAVSALAKQRTAITAMLDKLDAADDSKFRNRRAATRCPYRRIDICVRAHHPGGSVAAKLVATRNLGETGIGFLATSFLHIGTKVEVLLPRPIGGEDLVRGKVVFCAHVSGAFHQIGVKFDQRIVPKTYVDRESFEKMENAGKAPTTLAGKMLHIDPSEIDRKLLAHYLKSTKIELTSVASAAEALNLVKTTGFDLIACEVHLKTVDCDALIGQLREAGHVGRVMIITSVTNPEPLRAAKAAGAAALLTKPYEQSRLLSLVGAFLKRVTADNGIVSTLAGQAQMRPLIERYVQNISELAGDMERAITENQLDRLRQICSSLKGSGTSYGFALISESAKEALRTIDATSSLEESTAQVKKLVELCRRVITG